MKETQEHEENTYEKEEEDEEASIVTSSRGPVEIPTGSVLNEEENERTDSQAAVTDLEKIGDSSKEAKNKEGMYGMFCF